MKLALILNPFSGGENGRKHLVYILKRLEKKHIAYKVFVSRYHEHIIDICSRLEIDKFDGIAGIGGDGTNFQIINGLLKTYLPDQLPPIGIFPVGSGNSFAKDLSIETLDQGIDAVIRQTSKPVDVLSFSQGQEIVYFINLAGLGFVTDVADTARHFKIFKDFSYLMGVIYRTLNLSFHHIELTIDGRSFSGRNCFIEFCNSRYTGGNMLMAPKAKIDDGLMDIVIAEPLSRTSLLATLPKIFKGTHIDHPAVHYIQGKNAVIKTRPAKKLLPDGEITGCTPAVVNVHPKMLRYFV